MRKQCVLFAVVLAIAICLGGCSFGLEKEYYDDIRVDVDALQAEIIIKEWRFLSGSGAEVYFKRDGKEVLLGKLSGGDDGYCSFKEGMYLVDVEDGTLTIERCLYPSDESKPWEKVSFELPLIEQC
ncbi:MAG: hypothetical protein ACI3XI_06450 [Eubacteriales bacterium]